MRKISTQISFCLMACLLLLLSSTHAQVSISAGNAVTQNFDGIGNTATATMPAGWKVDKPVIVRTVGTYAAAVTATTAQGAASIATNAGNGIYNFGNSANANDRAVGGLSSGSASQSVNVYVDLLNTGATTIPQFTLSYDVEKYRLGTNAAGFSIQMYYSLDGSNWTSAGSNFLTSFPGGDATNNGFNPAPGATLSVVSKNITVNVTAGSHLYLAWNYSVTSGSTTTNAQALGLDNISISAGAALPANPILSVASSIAAFGAVPIGTGGVVKTFSLNGNDLNGSNVSIEALNGFSYSETGLAGSFTSTLSFTAAANFSAKSIFVKFDPTAVQSYNGNIVVSGGGALSLTIPVSGSGSNTLPVVMNSQPLLRYTEDFNSIGTWTDNFNSGTGANRFASVLAAGSGTIPNAGVTTTSTASFALGSTGGVQKGTNNLVLLATGPTDNTASTAVDFYMDFTGVNAGTLSFDWASINNGSGNRFGSLRVYASVDGINYTELVAADVINLINFTPSTGTVSSIALPAIFNNSATARLRFYYHNGTGGTTGSRPKISIDNLTVTAVPNTPCVTPASTPSALTFSNIAETSVQGNFLAASPAVNEYLVVMSENTSLTSLPINGQTYFVGDNLGDGTVISKGSSVSFTATGLTGATTYYFFVFPVNSVCTGGPLYLTTNPLSNTVTTVAGLPNCAAPAAQATNLITTASINTIQGSFTAAAADEYLVLQSTSPSFTGTLVNGTAYSVGAVLGNATLIQKGAGTTFTASGLNPATQYYYYIVSVNSQACLNGPVYNSVSPLSGSQTTLPLPLCVTPSAQPYSMSFNASNNSITATFNAAGSGLNYLVVISSSPSLTSLPVDNTDYLVGNSLGGGTVISNNISTSFIANSLSVSSTYYFFVFSANKNCTGGTKYLLSSPLTGNTSTTNAPVNNIYYGNLHAHSDYSDGNKDHPGFTPADDYSYAKGSMDFLGISEHNHFSSLDNPGNELSNYHLGVSQAAAFNAVPANSGLLALYGMEWGVISGGGHVVVYGDGLSDLFGWESNVNGKQGPNYDVYVPKNTYTGPDGLFKTINDYASKNAFATLAHPNSTDYNNLSNVAYDQVADDAISGVAVESGPATSTNTTFSNPGSSMAFLWYYQKLLAKGYHLGPTIDHDNHNTTFGRTTPARTAVIAPSLSQSDLIKAVRDMHFYATEDIDAKLDFTINTRIMGSIFEDRNAPSIAVKLTDPTTSTSNALIRVMFGIPGSGSLPVVVDSVFGSSLSYVDNNLPNHATGYYYVDITNGSSRIVTSPIWYTRTCASNGELTVAACDSYTWAGTTYTTSTTATKVFTTTGGCDSTVVLHLTINKSPAAATISLVGSDKGCPGTGVAFTATADVGNGAISSYEWIKDGNTVATTAVGNFTALTSGSYSVKAVTVNNCSVLSNSIAATVVDNIAPVADLSILPALSGECGVTVTTVPTATDNCAGIITAQTLDAVSYTTQGTYTITWTYNDGNGNTSSQTQTIIVKDNTAPVLTGVPSNVSVSCDAIPVAATVTATDNCEANPLVSFAEQSTQDANVTAVGHYQYTITRTWTAVDVKGNSSSASQTILVKDNTAPVLTGVPSNASVSCDAIPAAATVTATDNCDANPVVSFVEQSTQDANVTAVGHYQYTITRTWTAVDVKGNSSSASQIISVKDNTAPVLVGVPSNVSVSCDAIPAAATVTATDNCDANPLVSFAEQSTQDADVNSIGHYQYTITRTWTAVDVNGNSSAASQTITVKDKTAPVVTVPAAIVVSNDPTLCSAVVNFTATAADNCSPVTLSYSAPSGTAFPVGQSTVTVTAVDVSGNSASLSFTITVNDDEKPRIKAPGMVSVVNDPGQCGAVIVNIGTPLTQDNCGVASVTNDHPSNIYPVGTTIVTWTVIDIHGNVTDTAKQKVRVMDNELPTISVANMSVNNDVGTCGATVILTAPVTNDNCGVASVTNDHPSALFPVGVTNVTWTVTDNNGWTNTAVQTVTVLDKTKPDINAVTAQTFCISPSGTYTIPELTASDNCSGVISIAYSISGATTKALTAGSNASGAFNVGVSTINWVVTDAAGNISNSSTVVTVNALPSSTITVSNADAFCNKLTLTAGTLGVNPQYNWMFGNATVFTTQTISLGQNNPDGVYQLYVTSNNCTSAVASYTFSKQTLSSSYTIIGLNDIQLGENNTVASGSVGVVSANGEAAFRKNSSVASAGSFVKAKKISKNGPNVIITNPIYSAASGISLPTMLLNTATTNGLSNKDVNANGTVNGNYKNITIKKGIKATLTGNTFGTIRVEQGAQLTFTASALNVEKLQVVKGPRTGYSYVRFAPDTKVLVSGSVSIGSQVYINPDNYKVTFYLGDKKSDDEVFIVKGGDTKVTANVYITNGKLKVTGGYSYGDYGNGKGDSDKDDDDDKYYGQGNSSVYMTGLFIADEVTGEGKNIIWNSFDCNAAPVPVTNGMMITQSVVSPAKEVVATETELTVSVLPNPSTSFFTLKIESRYNTPVNLRVMDSRGRVVDAKSQIGANSTIQIGQNYAGGTYYAELIQGTKRKVVQLVKMKG